jgi:peptidoglycan/LPS O-acetylase OafA/YrhL
VSAGAVALGIYVAFAFATPWDLGALPAGLYTGLAAAGAVTVVAVVSVPGSRLARALAWRPLVGLGVLSYSVYIWHYPLFLYFHRHKLRGPLVLAVAVVVALIVAYLSYVAVERPFLRRRVRYRPRHVAVAGRGDLP